MTVGMSLRDGECLVVVAAAGYGKTTALEGLGIQRPQARLVSAAQLLAQLDTLAGTVGRRGLLIVDDIDQLAEPDQAALVAALGTVPGSVHLALASRRPLNPGLQAALRRPLRERDAADLALSVEATARVLREEHGVPDAEQAEAIHRITAGWPALVHLAGDALRRADTRAADLPGILVDASSDMATWIRDHVLAGMSPTMRAVLDLLGDTGPLAADLCRHLGALAAPGEAPSRPDGLEQAFADLARTGLLTRVPGPRLGGAPELWRVVPVIARVVQDRRPVARERLLGSATWYADHGLELWAAEMLERAGEPAQVAVLLGAHGEQMLAQGGAVGVAALIDGLPAAHRGEPLQLMLGDARRRSGDPDGAARAFAPLVESAQAAGAWAPGLAWRVAMVRYMCADYRGALAACDAAGPDVMSATGEDLTDAVMLTACRAGAHFALGEVEPSRRCARQAAAMADRAADDRCRAAASIALALGESGQDRERYLRRAMAAAEAAGDVMQLTRALVNHGDHLLESAQYPDALDVALRARAAAELGAPPGLLQAAMHNVGEALLRVGRYPEAEFAFERTTRLSRRIGLARAGAGLRGLGEVRHALGLREQSRMAYEEAVETARPSGDVQVLVPALCGLSRVLAEGSAADVAAARALAEEAESLAPEEMRPKALIARGWAALAEGELTLARDRAAEAVTVARSARAAAALAEALELTAAVAGDPEAARAAMAESSALWQRAGAVPAVDRLAVLSGRLPGASAADRVAAREAGRRLLELGVRSVDGRPVLPSDGRAASLRVRILGGFEVVTGGRPVPLTAWRSRQARTLVKILVARRGRPVPRGEICELLWPDDEPQRTAHRLSVLLSAVRTVLDPAKTQSPDHFVGADSGGLWLVHDHVVVDAEELVRDAAHAIQLARSGYVERAREALDEVDLAYVGDAFDDEPYEDWPDALREETRAAWLRSVRAAAELARGSGDDDQAIGRLVRLLAADPLDESVHRTLVSVLVAAGRHGEARRAFDRWTAAMRSIDAPPPSPEVLHRSP